jgi:hypothetical protein
MPVFGKELEEEHELAEAVRRIRTVLVVGMKDRPGEPAHDIPAMLLARGVRVIPVNPKLPEVLGQRAYPRIADVPESFDTVDVFRRAEFLPQLAREIVALPSDRRPRLVWFQSGIQSEEAAEVLVQAGIQVVQDRCLGVYASRYLPRPSTSSVP